MDNKLDSILSEIGQNVPKQDKRKQPTRRANERTIHTTGNSNVVVAGNYNVNVASPTERAAAQQKSHDLQTYRAMKLTLKSATTIRNFSVFTLVVFGSLYLFSVQTNVAFITQEFMRVSAVLLVISTALAEVKRAKTAAYLCQSTFYRTGDEES